jgi:hypothetical protein
VVQATFLDALHRYSNACVTRARQGQAGRGRVRSALPTQRGDSVPVDATCGVAHARQRVDAGAASCGTSRRQEAASVVGMRKMMCVALAAFSTLALGACEMGWDVDGQVSAKDVRDRGRSLYILVAKGGPPGSDPSTWAYRSVSTGSTAADRFAFAYSDLGCAHDVAVVAWAPAVKPADEANLHFTFDFHPAPGDYVARSPVVHPKCGWWKHPVHLPLELRQEP